MQNIAKKILKVSLYILSSIILIVLFICFYAWATTPIYKFPEAIKFSGNKFYNPYKDYDNKPYVRANFHGHSKLLKGITDGRSNSSKDVYKAYRDLEYGFATISNYHTITKEPTYYDFPYIPAQEYGINIFKTHLILIGTRKKALFDQPLYQSVNTIQYRIKKVRPYNEIVTLAHPSFLNGVKVDYMGKLTGYDLMEVVNTFAHSVEHWDKALSSGRPTFLLASDDTHNVFRNTDFGRNITMLPLDPKTESDKVYDTLKAGSSYGITVPHSIAALDRKEKLEVLKTHPQLLSMEIIDNNLSVKLNRQVDKITFSADNGDIREEFENTQSAIYNISDNDSYVRVTAYFDNGSIAYFNPIIRTNDGLKPKMPNLAVNRPLTIIKWIFSLGLVIGIFSFFMFRKRKGE